MEEWENPSRRRWEKPSRVLVLTGSPRRRAGFTGLYLQPLVDGMKSAGAEVEVVDVYDRALDLEPCLGCFACWRSGPESCSLKGDDAALLLARIEETLLVVWALPLYADSVPARVKTLLDRHFILLEPVFVPYGGVTRHPVRWPRPRYTALFAVCGFPEVSHFDPLVAMFEDVARNGHRPLVATLLRPGAEFLAKAPTCAPYLRRVLAALEEAGRELVLSGRVPKAISRTVSSGFGIPPDTWREQANMHFHLESRTEPGGGPHA